MCSANFELFGRYDLISSPVVEIKPVGITDHPEIMIPVLDDLRYTPEKNITIGINQRGFIPAYQFHVTVKLQ